MFIEVCDNLLGTNRRQIFHTTDLRSFPEFKGNPLNGLRMVGPGLYLYHTKSADGCFQTCEHEYRKTGGEISREKRQEEREMQGSTEDKEQRGNWFQTHWEKMMEPKGRGK